MRCTFLCVLVSESGTIFLLSCETPPVIDFGTYSRSHQAGFNTLTIEPFITKLQSCEIVNVLCSIETLTSKEAGTQNAG